MAIHRSSYGPPVSPVFITTIYCATEKPLNVCGYLNGLIHELKIIIVEGMQFRRITTNACVQLVSIVVNAPLKAMMKQVKYHCGYFSCNLCTIHVCNSFGRVVFIYINSRMDVDFRSHRQQEHHARDSPIEAINDGMTETFPTEHMPRNS